MQERPRFELKLRHLPILAAVLMAMSASDARATDAEVEATESPAKAERGDPKAVTVENGKGDLLVTKGGPITLGGPAVGLKPREKIEVKKLKPELLDGTLEIITTWENGEITTDTLYHRPGHKVSVRWDGGKYVLVDLGPIEKKERGGGD